MANHTILHPELHNPQWLRDQALVKTDAQIAADLGCSRTRVKQRRQKFSIPACQHQPAPTNPKPHHHRESEKYTPATQIRHRTTLIVCCPRCKWLAYLPAIYDHDAWRLEPDPKVRLTPPKAGLEANAIHVPCGQPLRLSAFAQAQHLTLRPPWQKGDDNTR